jgi:macrolide transport system ATP-binding/permease protein
MPRALDHLLHDLRFALRQLRRNPAFTVTAIVVLALGLCASIAIFSFVDAALLKPLPYRDPSRLAGLYERIPLCERCNLSYFDYLDWKRMNKTLASLEIYQTTGFMVGSPEGAVRAQVVRISAGFFRTLGVSPAIGRDFADGEDQPSAARVVILSYPSWQNRYGGKREAIGQTMTLDGEPYTIIGILPPDFHFAPSGSAEFWSALHTTHGCEDRRSCHDLYGIGRLKDGVSMESAAADFALIASQLEAQYPDSNRGQASNVVPLGVVIVGRIRPVLIMLLAGSALLLLIAAVNVANLLLVRSEGRKREIAVRSGLGASRARLAAQFITEGVLLVLSSAALGLLAAHWLTEILTRLIPVSMLNGMPFLNGLGLHSREWAFAAAVSLAAAILFTLTPVVRLSLADPRAGLAESGRGHSGAVWKRLGSHLVVVELATAVVLLAGAGLLGKSLYRVLQVDLGMRPDHLATVQVGAPQASYSKDDQFIALHREILRRVSALPGVESAATSSLLPITGGNTSWIRFADRPWYGEHNDVGDRRIAPDYFTTLGTRLLRGRYFTESDDASKPRFVIVDRAFAEKYYPSKDPIGQQIFYQTHDAKPMTIVGLVDDIKEGAIDTVTWPTMYVPFNQDPRGYFTLVVRSSQDEHAFLPTLVSAVHQLDPGLMTGGPHTMGDQINNSPAAYLRRCSAWLAGGFAILALILGVVGLYGVIAYSVSQRTREIGVRIALGARPQNVYRLILGEAAWLVIAGVSIGLACSIGAAMLLRDLLFNTQSWDAPTFAAVASLLALSALAASFLPARRAASMKPIEALRSE